jgi:hypothetical protein
MTLTARRPTQETADIVAALGGTWHGAYAMCRCPAHSDSDPSLSIRQGDTGILVHCFAGCDSEAVLRAISRIAITPGSAAPAYKAPTCTANVERIWSQAVPVPGTLAARYLERRNLPADLPDIRFHPRCPLGRKPDTQFKPALLAAARHGRELRAIQRIFLDPDTCWHTGKYMLGLPGMAAWKPPFSGTALAIAEGLEDAAAFTQLHGITCWAAFGTRRLPLLAIPDQVDTLMIAEDNNAPGRAAAAKAASAYARPGRRILTINPTPFGDWAEANEQRGRGRMSGA